MRTKSVDVEILKKMYFDDKLKLREIATKTGLTVEGVRYHLKQTPEYKKQKEMVFPEFLERLKGMDTSKLTSNELYKCCQDLYPNKQSFRQALSNSKIVYKKIK